MLLRFSLIATLLAPVLADIYMHNPRGSNNRLHETGRDRTNANRLFDSQNNARGGYNAGSLAYFAGSELTLEWTVQHSCGDDNNHCDIVLQYMCNADARDGVNVNTIPSDNKKCANSNCGTDIEFGMHESHEHFVRCSTRERNRGLFVADRKLKGQTAKFTRQNQNGNRYGYECPEERDHYPYWASSPWKDIAILTDDTGRCERMRNGSANLADKSECWLPVSLLTANPGTILPLDKDACEKVSVNGTRASWKTTKSWNLPAPECRQVERTRDNHLGNTRMFEAVQYNWTVPDDAIGGNCILRIRYNVSTADYNGWSTFSDAEVSPASGSSSVGSSRGFEFKNNPTVQIFADSPKFGLQLQLNTAEYGRVFQDRSHVFTVKRRPESVKADARIVNVNVKGKRGNIVQVYPSVEYDFIPRLIEVSPGDFLHLHWTGSNTNNGGNDGQGLAGSDRSNVMPLLGNDLATNLVDNGSLGWLSDSDAVTIATLSPPQLGGNLQWLDDAGTNFDLGLRKVTSVGDWAFMSTRNNDFSNRSHKGRIVSNRNRRRILVSDRRGGEFSLLNGRVKISVPAGAFWRVTYLQVQLSNNSWSGSQPNGDTWFTEFLHFSADDSSEFAEEVTVTLKTLLDPTEGHDVHVFRYETSSPASLGYRTLDSSTGTSVTFRTKRPGLFGVRGFADGPVSVVGIVVGVLVAVAIVVVVGLLVAKHRRDPNFFPEKIRFLKRSAKSDV